MFSGLELGWVRNLADSENFGEVAVQIETKLKRHSEGLHEIFQQEGFKSHIEDEIFQQKRFKQKRFKRHIEDEIFQQEGFESHIEDAPDLARVECVLTVKPKEKAEQFLDVFSFIATAPYEQIAVQLECTEYKTVSSGKGDVRKIKLPTLAGSDGDDTHPFLLSLDGNWLHLEGQAREFWRMLFLPPSGGGEKNKKRKKQNSLPPGRQFLWLRNGQSKSVLSISREAPPIQWTAVGILTSAQVNNRPQEGVFQPLTIGVNPYAEEYILRTYNSENSEDMKFGKGQSSDGRALLKHIQENFREPPVTNPNRVECVVSAKPKDIAYRRKYPDIFSFLASAFPHKSKKPANSSSNEGAESLHDEDADIKLRCTKYHEVMAEDGTFTSVALAENVIEVELPLEAGRRIVLTLEGSTEPSWKACGLARFLGLPDGIERLDQGRSDSIKPTVSVELIGDELIPHFDNAELENICVDLTDEDAQLVSKYQRYFRDSWDLSSESGLGKFLEHLREEHKLPKKAGHAKGGGGGRSGKGKRKNRPRLCSLTAPRRIWQLNEDHVLHFRTSQTLPGFEWADIGESVYRRVTLKEGGENKILGDELVLTKSDKYEHRFLHGSLVELEKEEELDKVWKSVDPTLSSRFLPHHKPGEAGIHNIVTVKTDEPETDVLKMIRDFSWERERVANLIVLTKANGKGAREEIMKIKEAPIADRSFIITSVQLANGSDEEKRTIPEVKNILPCSTLNAVYWKKNKKRELMRSIFQEFINKYRGDNPPTKENLEAAIEKLDGGPDDGLWVRSVDPENPYIEVVTVSMSGPIWRKQCGPRLALYTSGPAPGRGWIEVAQSHHWSSKEVEKKFYSKKNSKHYADDHYMYGGHVLFKYPGDQPKIRTPYDDRENFPKGESKSTRKLRNVGRKKSRSKSATRKSRAQRRRKNAARMTKRRRGPSKRGRKRLAA